MEPIQGMLDYNAKIPKLNVAKKPDSGIYFDHIRYVDQYVNWYTNSHSKEGEMLPWKRQLMIQVVQLHFKNIMKYVKDLKAVTGIAPIITRYEKALYSRTSGDIYANINSNDYGRYFYLQGMAALMSKLPPEYKEYDGAIRTGETFMEEAMKIAPRIARRDLVMASTFIYLMRKEDKLCR
jgi:hypothetical protein